MSTLRRIAVLLALAAACTGCAAAAVGRAAPRRLLQDGVASSGLQTHHHHHHKQHQQHQQEHQEHQEQEVPHEEHEHEHSRKTPGSADRPHDVAVLLRGLQATGGTCVDEWKRDPTNKAYKELSLHYGEDPVSNHAQTCSTNDNSACVASRSDGCALWGAIGQLCPGRRTCTAGYVYLGDNSDDKNHVILVPTAPTRGLDDIVDRTTSAKAIAATEKLWGTFWAESVARRTGAKDSTGFESPETGALVINPPFYREYHQMHIHAGKRVPALDNCIRKLKPSAAGAWEHVHCSGLTGNLGQTDAELFYATVTDLSTIWRVYLNGLAQPDVAKALSAAGFSAGSIQQYGGYHVGMLVTSPPAWQKAGEFLVILYAPSAKAAQNPDLGKLGRGQFITNNKS